MTHKNNCTWLDEGFLLNEYSVNYGTRTQTEDVDAVHFKQPIQLKKAYEPIGKKLTLKDVLGNARYFGIVANVWDQHEAETNAAVKKLIPHAQSGNDLVDYIEGAADDPHVQPWYIGEIATEEGASNSLHIKGDSAEVHIPADSIGKLKNETGETLYVVDETKEDINEYVEDMLQYVRDISADLATKNSVVEPTRYMYTNVDKSKAELDFTKFGDGTLYIDLDRTMAGTTETLLDVLNKGDSTLAIRKNPGQTIVFNSKAEQVQLRKFEVYDGGYHESTDSINMGHKDNNDQATKRDGTAESLVWNFPNAKTATIDGAVTGIFLLPEASVTLNTTCGGWMVADKFTNAGSQEWHDIWQHYDHDYHTIAKVEATKTVDGQQPGSKEFAFQLLDENGTVVETAYNDNAGAIEFDDMHFDTAGTYRYTLREQAGSESGVVYDTAVYDVVVIVTRKEINLDESTKGVELSTSVTYQKRDESGEPPAALPVFNNTTDGTQQPETTSVSGAKVWADDGIEGTSRPESITVRLLANGQRVEGKVAVATAADGWKFSFADLPKAGENNTPITYSIEEDAVKGYDSAITGDAATGFTVTNTVKRGEALTPVELTVLKTDADGAKLPGAEFTLTASDNTTQTFTTGTDGTVKIPFSAEGTWKLKETKAPVGYTADSAERAITVKKGATPTVAYDAKSGKWVSTYALVFGEGVENNQITVVNTKSTREDVAHNALTVNKTDAAGRALSGAAFKLYADEACTNEVASYTGGTFTISTDDAALQSHLPAAGETTALYLKETQAPQDYAVDTTVRPVLLSATTATELKDNVFVTTTTYSITVDGKDTLNVPNTYAPEKTSIIVTKKWVDASDRDHKRPGSIQVQLLANGTAVDGKVATLSGTGDEWTYTFADLPVRDTAGNAINYTVDEVAVPEGYTKSIEGLAITNTYTKTVEPETTSATIKKVWDDANNQDGVRPLKLTVTLVDDLNRTAGTAELNAQNNWTATIDNLPKGNEGQEITYKWLEPVVAGYTLSSTTVDAASNTTTLINKHTPAVTQATVKKVWEDDSDKAGKRPASIKVSLMNGAAKVRDFTLSEANKWTAEATGLAAYSNGTVINYTWVEGDMPKGYTLKSNATQGMVTTITNTFTAEETSATVKKVWDDADDHDGKRPSSLTVRLSNGQTFTLNAANKWTATAEHLPKHDAQGKEIVYTWTEDEVAGYTGGSVRKDSVTTFTNTHEVEKTSVDVKKVWADGADADGIRPASIMVRLLGNGAEVATARLDANNSWAHTFDGLYVYGADGKKVTYTVEEDVPKGYTSKTTGSAGEGFTITNTHKWEKPKPEDKTDNHYVSIPVEKIWDDNGGEDAVDERPEAVFVKLFANGKDTGLYVVLRASEGWTGKFVNLPAETKSGADVEYKMVEGLVKYYSSAPVEKDGVWSVTNTVNEEQFEEEPVPLSSFDNGEELEIEDDDTPKASADGDDDGDVTEFDDDTPKGRANGGDDDAGSGGTVRTGDDTAIGMLTVTLLLAAAGGSAALTAALMNRRRRSGHSR